MYIFETLLSILELILKNFKCNHFWRKDNGTNAKIEEIHVDFSAASILFWMKEM